MRAEPSPTAPPLEERLHGLAAAELDSGARDLVRFGRAFLAASLFGLGFWAALGFVLYRLLA